ncbi:hypothetical protein IHE45_08G067900 [Dioscorea alata]|uniref:Uncharacterized protein n=1 Tax=Dioscorea alata TaxID=55571 RepID=A0ACB7VJH4_DIOAL|nr:hypothetical protein IHE45_08G067900 [Dioscorea alata]
MQRKKRPPAKAHHPSRASPASNALMLSAPFHQMQQYYRYGNFDNCFGKWNALFDCLSLKTKRPSEVQEILEAREKAKPHIWTYRTVEEASANWWRMYSHIVTAPRRPDEQFPGNRGPSSE